jgi:hypothetical protein
MFVVVAVYIILYKCYGSSSEFVKVSFICKFLKREVFLGGGEGSREATWFFLGGGGELRDHVGDLGIDGRIIIKLIFNKWDGEGWNGLSWLRMRTGGRHL